MSSPPELDTTDAPVQDVTEDWLLQNLYQMVTMIVLNELNLNILGTFGWDTALFSNVTLSAGSISFYVLETLFA